MAYITKEYLKKEKEKKKEF